MIGCVVSDGRLLSLQATEWLMLLVGGVQFYFLDQRRVARSVRRCVRPIRFAPGCAQHRTDDAGHPPTGGKHRLYNGVCVSYCGFNRGSLFIAEGSLFIAEV